MSKRIVKKYENLGLTGLANLGNTCFLNSTLQCLSHTYELNEFLNIDNGKGKKVYESKLNRVPDSLILMEWDKLRKLMWSENCTINPAGFVDSIQKVATIKDAIIFSGYAQNDLTEFLTFVIDCFHNSLKREVTMNIKGNVKNNVDKLAMKCYEMMRNMYKKEYSEFLKLFYGIHVSQVKSIESNYSNITPEPFFNLLLEIDSFHSLKSSIKTYTRIEKMEGDCKLLNDEIDRKENGEKRIIFWELPDILVITLKRFTPGRRKNQAFVDFPLENFDLREYVVGYQRESCIYDLYGICNHSGGTQGGHYTSFVKNANGTWYHFNDTRVSEIKDLRSLKTPKAYCFFYRKKKY